MKEINRLAKKGWAKGMIHQGTLSLILSLDDFLMSGPHMASNTEDEILKQDPNILIMPNSSSLAGNYSTMTTYYILRPFIRGILYGLNSLYQISLYVPCKNEKNIQMYKEIISKVDIGQQFFQDRIYWDIEVMKRDILDRRLACFICPTSKNISGNDWLNKIILETKPFEADLQTNLMENNALFDLVEIRSFLEEMHQRFFSRLSESKKMYFVDMIKTVIIHDNHKLRKSGHKLITFTSGFYSRDGTSEKIEKPFRSDRFEKAVKPTKKSSKETGRNLFLSSAERRNQSTGDLDFRLLLDEYEEIVKEQFDTSQKLHQSQTDGKSLTKLLCRWNSITMRKSDILRILLKAKDKKCITDKLNELNGSYYDKQFSGNINMNFTQRQMSAVEMQRSDSTDSDASNAYLVISSDYSNNNVNSNNNSSSARPSNDSTGNNSELSNKDHNINSELYQLPRFTTWYTKPIKT